MARFSLPDDLREPLRQFLSDTLHHSGTVISDPHGVQTVMLDFVEEQSTGGAAAATLPTLAGELLATGDPTGEAEDIEAAPTHAHLLRTQLMATGGMGEIHKSRDFSLHRDLVMKVLHTKLNKDNRMRARFVEEAQITAQLSHPGIPPIHEMGSLPDGRPFFTMKLVHGRTLADVIHELHSKDDTEWTEHKVIATFQRVCEALGYAHARGVIHCDIKPANIMVGAFGEVLVMDWGVARLVEGDAETEIDEAPVKTRTEAGNSRGSVAGTPAYMPPEQAMGDVDTLGPPADVYAVGVMLYEALTGGRPYKGRGMELVVRSSRGEIPPIVRRQGSIIDDAIVAIIHKAMAPDPEERYAHGGALGDDLARWREGALKRERAQDLVTQANVVLPEVEPRHARATALREMAKWRLGLLGREASIDAKRAAWNLQDEAIELEREASLKTVEVTQLLHGALVHAPDLEEANRLLARIHFERHEKAEQRRDWDEAAGHEVLLRAHDVGDYADYLAGTAPLSFACEPPGEVSLYKYAEHGRQLVPELMRELGTTPIVDVELPVGSYLLEINVKGRPTVRYPVVLDRLQGWNGRRPGEEIPHAVRIPTENELTDAEVWVPAGWFEFGGDEAAEGAGRARRLWVNSFAIQRTPVTNRRFFEFLASPVGQQFRHEALRDGLGTWHSDWPAVDIEWSAAAAYAAWWSERTGQTWRLPSEVEWEKAARGVDGRHFPWGDFVDPAFCNVRSPQVIRRMPAVVSAFEFDRSPYGIWGMGGNVRDWCADEYRIEGPEVKGNRAVPPTTDRAAVEFRSVRGGSWRQPLESARAATRTGLHPLEGHNDVGLRMVRDV